MILCDVLKKSTIFLIQILTSLLFVERNVMDRIRVSVVVPVYNSERYLEECIDSILDQTLEGIEIICVDDGSEDCSLKILNSYREHYENFQIIAQRNKYAGVARNNGMKIAHGEYIIFLDSDDTFNPEMLQCMYEKITSTNSDICLCGARCFDSNTGEIFRRKNFLNNIPKKDPFSWRDIPESIYDITSPSPWNMLFSLEFLKENDLAFEECKRANDLRFYGCSLAAANKITSVSDVFVNYRVGHGTNLQANHNHNYLTEYNSLKQIRSYLKTKGIFPELEKAFYKLCVRNINYVLERKNNTDYDMLISYITNDSEALFSLDELKETFGEDHKLYLMMQSHFSSSESNKAYYNLYENRERVPVQVSVIVTAFNDEAYISECLLSLENQTFKEYEIIIVNDGSSDTTEQICKEFLAHTSIQTVFISKENGGLPSAKNFGIEYAKGDYIKFLNGDDYYTSDAIELCLSAAKKYDTDVLITNIEAYPDVKDDSFLKMKTYDFNISCARKHNYFLPCDGKQLFIKMSIQNEFIASMEVMTLKRDFIETNKLRFIENIFYEDDYFAVEAMMNANNVKYLDKTVYMRRVHHNFIMTSTDNSLKKGESRLLIAERIFSKYFDIAMRYEDLRLVFCLNKFIDSQINAAINLIFPKPSEKRFNQYILPYSIDNPAYYCRLSSYYDLRMNNNKLNNRIEKMESSKTWRYTKPLRTIRCLAKRNRTSN